MNKEDLLERITINPKVMVGKPVIKGTRLTAEYILGLLAHGTTIDEMLEEYPCLVKDDIGRGVCGTICSSLAPAKTITMLPQFMRIAGDGMTKVYLRRCTRRAS